MYLVDLEGFFFMIKFVREKVKSKGILGGWVETPAGPAQPSLLPDCFCAWVVEVPLEVFL
jgi:hypothetical protein